MSSVSKTRDKKGLRLVITLTKPEYKRFTLRLGQKTAKRVWNDYESHLRDLLIAYDGGESIKHRTIEWLDSLTMERHEQIARWGIINFRMKDIPFIQFLREYESIRSSKTGYADSTRRKWSSVIRIAARHFGETIRVSEVSSEMADEFTAVLRSQSGRKGGKKSDSTIARTNSHLFQAMEWAIRKGLIRTNPFLESPRTDRISRLNEKIVSRSVVDTIIKTLKKPEDRMVLGMARYAGVRVPSEVENLKIGDWDRERNLISVLSPKTAGRGKPSRLIPLEPELTILLEDNIPSDASPEDWMFPSLRRSKTNQAKGVRDRVLSAMKSLNIPKWDSLFQCLRRSAITDWFETYGLSKASRWTGNTPKIMEKYYLQLGDSKAVDAVAAENKQRVDALRLERQGANPPSPSFSEQSLSRCA